ncbi:MAG: hypothetical protein RBT37_08125 [Dissulfurispiraceae bacterium]|jgi:hypothetical protein|nr:hypothetical protein [Dissulfurispiraceae bacterium]
MNKFEQILIQPLQMLYEKILLFIPNFLAAAMILLTGIFLAWLLKLTSLKILASLKIDNFSERVGLDSILHRGGLKNSLSAILSMMASTIVIFTFSVISLRALDIPAVERLLEKLFLYLPNIFVALLIMFLGYIFSNFIGRAVLIASVNAGIQIAELISKIVKTAVVLLTATMVLEQLGIGSSTIIVAFAIVFGGIILALAIAFGLGGRDMAAEYLKKKLIEKEKKDDIDHL